MNNFFTQRFSWFAIIILTIVTVVVLWWKYSRFYGVVSDTPKKMSVEIPKEQEVAPEDTVEFTNTYITGFEEEQWRVSYSFKYQPNFIAIDASGPHIFIREQETGLIHKVTIFYNGAAGFSSTQHFWEEMNVCGDCRRMSPTIDIGESKDLIMYTDGQKEWAIFERDPGFVMVEFANASGRAKQVISSLNMSVTKTAPFVPWEEVVAN